MDGEVLFPAQAGVIPPCASLWALTGLLFPAQAGVILRSNRRHMSGKAVPRASGGDPLH